MPSIPLLAAPRARSGSTTSHAPSSPGRRRGSGGHHRRDQAGAAAPLLYAVTDARTLVAHLVVEDALVTGRRSGCFRTVCGELVLAASLTVEERFYCRSCACWWAER